MREDSKILVIVIPRINGLSDSTEAQASQERKRTRSTCASEKHGNNGNGDNAINYGNDYTLKSRDCCKLIPDKNSSNKKSATHYSSESLFV
jgi:hypothetical protein